MVNPVGMDIEKLLLREQSRSNTDFLIEVLRVKSELFTEFWRIMMRNEDPVSRRSAWVVDCFTEYHPEYIENRIEELSVHLPDFKSDGLKRHSMRMLSRSKLPVENLGVLVDISFRWLQSPAESVAVKMYCVTILDRVTLIYPEFKSELRDIIEIQLNEATPGFKSIARKVLKRL